MGLTARINFSLLSVPFFPGRIFPGHAADGAGVWDGAVKGRVFVNLNEWTFSTSVMGRAGF